MSSSIHVANNYSQTIFVAAAREKDWVIADDVFDIGVAALSFCTGAMGIGAALDGFPTTLKTFGDLVSFFKGLGLLAGGMYGIAHGAEKTVLGSIKLSKDLQQLKEKMISIESKNFASVFDTSLGHQLFSPSGWADDFGDATVEVLIVTDDLKVKHLTSTDDTSWIANGEGIVQTEYGHLWVPQPGAVPQRYVAGYKPAGNFYKTAKDLKITLSCDLNPSSGTPISRSMDITNATNLELNNINGDFQNVGNGAVTGFVPNGSYKQSAENIKVELTCQCETIAGDWKDASFDLTGATSVYLENMDGNLVNKAS